MTPRLRPLIAILVALLVHLSLTPAISAQDLDATAGKLDLASLDGVQTAVSRTYAVDIQTLVDRSTGATPPEGEAPAEAPLLMLALVAEFDTTDNAEDAASAIQERLLDQPPVGTTGITLEGTEVDALGDLAWQVSGTRTSPEAPLAIDGFVVQDTTWVYLTLAISDTDSAADAARNLVDDMLRNRPGTDEVVYDVTGTSRGGIWDMLPADGDTSTAEDTLSGTQPIYDNQLIPPAPPETEG